MAKGLAVITALALCPMLGFAGDAPRIAIIDSATPVEALIDRPGTFLGETFTFEQMQTGDINIQVGVWEAGIGALTLTDFPFTEYVLMISGRVVVTEDDGRSMTFGAGDTFVIPKGWTGIWDVKERMKKQIVRIGDAPE